LSPCGEAGEYHTLVVNGPLFKEKLEVEVSGYRSEEKVIFLGYIVKK
jgi:diphthamide synthase (EF-2-diphthine--ammonia ligase)